MNGEIKQKKRVQKRVLRHSFFVQNVLASCVIQKNVVTLQPQSLRAEQNGTIKEEKKQNPSPSYLTPDACPPDPKNGGYMTFTSDIGTTTYVQVTNDLNLWFKNVSKEGFALNSTSFNGEAAQKLIDYIKLRER